MIERKHGNYEGKGNEGGRVREKGPDKGNSPGNILRHKDHDVPCNNGEEARAGKVRG